MSRVNRTIVATLIVAFMAAGAAADTERLATAVKQAEAGRSPSWVAWSVPIADKSATLCCHSEDGAMYACRLGGDSYGISFDGSRGGGSTALRIFARFDGGRVARVRTFSDGCLVDTSGETVEDVGRVDPVESLKLLEPWLDAPDRVAEAALGAIALHEGAAAELVVERVATSPDRHRLRRSAIFWLGRTGGARGFSVVKRYAWGDESELWDSAVFAVAESREPGAGPELVSLAQTHPRGEVRGKALFWLSHKHPDGAIDVIREAALHDRDAHVRKQAVFAASQLDDPAATDLLIDLANGRGESDVRRSAIFWLSQKAGKSIGKTLRGLADDPDDEIRKQAVFAISQRPDDESIPILTDLAKHHPSAAVRKRALFWLGQKDDPRVVDVFAEILGQ